MCPLNTPCTGQCAHRAGFAAPGMIVGCCVCEPKNGSCATHFQVRARLQLLDVLGGGAADVAQVPALRLAR